MKIKPEVLAVLSTLEINVAGVVRITQTLERALYTKVNKVLEACGFAWSRKEKAHIAPGRETAREKLEQVMLTGEVETARDIGFFPTPVKLAAQLVELAEVDVGLTHDVLEPSAGTGRIVDAIVKAGGLCYFVERDPDMWKGLCQKLGPLYSLTPSSGPNDFLQVLPQATFDRVIMNPPFIDYLDHVYHAWDFLKPGGILVSVLPAGVKFRMDKKHVEFRNWLENRTGVMADLPPNAFKESGTNVNTVTIKVRK